MDEDKQREKRQRDLDDAQNEAAGRDTGRIRRFLTEDRSPQAVAARKSQLLWNDLLMMTIQSERFRERLDELDRASEYALRVAERRAREAQDHLEQLQKRASTDDDGRRVYLTRDGRHAYDETGQRLTPEAQARVQWKRDAPTWEEYREGYRSSEKAVRELEEIKAYRERLQQGREKLNRGEDLDGLEKDLEKMPDGVRRQLEKSGTQKSAAHEYLRDDPLPSAPDLSAAFAAVTNPPRPGISPDAPTLNL